MYLIQIAHMNRTKFRGEWLGLFGLKESKILER